MAFDVAACLEVDLPLALKWLVGIEVAWALLPERGTRIVTGKVPVLLSICVPADYHAASGLALKWLGH